MTTLVQVYTPALKMYDGTDRITVEQRTFEYGENPTNLKVEKAKNLEMGFIGQFQIEEVWKHYYKEYYISNYGYIVKIAKEDAEIADIVIPDVLKNADEDSSGVRWLDFPEEVKLLFRRNAYVPKN